MAGKFTGTGKMTDAARAFAVHHLACYDRPSEVVALLKEDFGLEITPQAVEYYDPTKHRGQKLGKKWRALFHEVRKKFLEDTAAAVPLANKSVRINELAKAAEAFRKRGNYKAMAEVVEQIAKEMGNVHTNRRELTGKDGGPLQVEHSDLTDEQLTARMVQLMSAAMADGGDGAGADG